MPLLVNNKLECYMFCTPWHEGIDNTYKQAMPPTAIPATHKHKADGVTSRCSTLVGSCADSSFESVFGRSGAVGTGG